MPVGTLAGVALAKYRVRFEKTIQLYLLLPFTIPLIGSGIGLMLIFGEAGVLGQLWPVGIACCVINLPFMIWAVTASVERARSRPRECRGELRRAAGADLLAW